MTYYPDPLRYQQIDNGDPFGPFDCTAWAAAFDVDAHTEGTFKTTGTAIRRHSNEATPDPRSPGLNLDQVDEAVNIITKGKVDFDTHWGLDIDIVQHRIIDGRYAELQVNRGVLVDAGYGGDSGFRGGHAISVSWRVGAPVIFDPLVRHVMRASWTPIWRACGALWTGSHVLGYGRANVGFTRDVTPDWTMRIPAGRNFSTFTVSKGAVVPPPHHHHTPNGFSALCTPPFWASWPGHDRVKLVTITTGFMEGKNVRAKWAQEINQ